MIYLCIGSDGFTIDIDSTDFGYRIGEIELMVSEEDAADAVQQIDGFARKQLGLMTDALSTGKLEIFLFTYNRDSFDRLVAAGVIPHDAVDAAEANATEATLSRC